jgi:hypothetical protein
MPHLHLTVGTRAQVFHGTAKHTSGGLQKSDLMQNKSGRIVSRKKHASAKREMRLLKHGFGTKKGKFGVVKMAKGKKSRKHRKGHRGGSALDNAAPLDYVMGENSGSSGNFADSVSQTALSVSEYNATGGKRRRGKKGKRGGMVPPGTHVEAFAPAN